MIGSMPGAVGGPIPMPVVTRVRCHRCAQLRPARECKKVLLAAGDHWRRNGWRCRKCAS